MQGGLTALFYILQRFGTSLCATPNGRAAIAQAARCALTALQGVNILREAAGSASIVLWAAAALPAPAPAAAAATLARGLFGCSLDLSGDLVLTGPAHTAWEAQVRFDRDLD